MAINKKQRGFALLIAVIFMSVVLSFGLSLSSLGYKQAVLASNAVESQYAFYAADAALECTLYADQQQFSFTYPAPYPVSPAPTAPPIQCNGAPPISSSTVSYNSSYWEVAYRLSPDAGSCADVTVYKYSPTYNSLNPGSPTTYVFSQGYDVACSAVGTNPRYAARGLSYHY
ncbi:MAG: hypothetical protein ACYC6X_01040 [Minisyncoccota bacterium]